MGTTGSAKIYKSKHGLTLKGKDGHFYALRFPANRTVKAAEQWYWMNKATNFEEFQKALEILLSNGKKYCQVIPPLMFGNPDIFL